MHNEVVAYPFVKLRDFDCYQVRLLMPLELVETRLLLDELTKNEGEQFLVVASLCDILPEALSLIVSSSYPRTSPFTHPFERFLDGKFLRTDKAANGDGNSQVYVVGTNILSKAHLGTGFCHPNHAL